MAAKILIVDDSPNNLHAMKRIFKNIDIVIQTSSSGEEALGTLLTENFDLVLLDIQMPEMTGYEVLEMMRSIERTRSIPVIFLSGHQDVNTDLLVQKDLGAISFIRKPIDTSKLLATIGEYVDIPD